MRLNGHKAHTRHRQLRVSSRSKPAFSTRGVSGRQSRCQPHRAWIEQKVAAGCNAQRTCQDLVVELGFAGSYQSVNRFVRRLRRVQQHARYSQDRAREHAGLPCSEPVVDRQAGGGHDSQGWVLVYSLFVYFVVKEILRCAQDDKSVGV